MTNSQAPSLPDHEARLSRRAVALAAVAGLIGLGFGPRIGLSVLGGAAVSVMNILVMRRVVRGLTAADSGRSAIIAAALTGVRFLLLGGVLFAIIAVWNADVIGVVCGLGAPLLAVLAELGSGGFGSFRTPPNLPPPGSPEGREGNPPDAV